MLFHNLALKLAQDIQGGADGFTIKPLTETIPTVGYAVGGDPEIPEVRIAGARTAALPVLKTLIDAHLDLCHGWTLDGVAGGWVHEGDLYLDAPTIMWHLDDALRLAKERGELAIFDIANGREILLADHAA